MIKKNYLNSGEKNAQCEKDHLLIKQELEEIRKKISKNSYFKQ